MAPSTGHQPRVGMRGTDLYGAPQVDEGLGAAVGRDGQLELPSRASRASFPAAGGQAHLHALMPGLPHLPSRGLSCSANPFWQGGVGAGAQESDLLSPL